MAEDDEDEEAERAIGDLAGGIAKDGADAWGVEACIDVEPVAGGDPGEDAEREEEGFDFGGEEKFVGEGEPLAEGVGEFEGGRGEADVG